MKKRNETPHLKELPLACSCANCQISTAQKWLDSIVEENTKKWTDAKIPFIEASETPTTWTVSTGGGSSQLTNRQKWKSSGRAKAIKILSGEND